MLLLQRGRFNLSTSDSRTIKYCVTQGERGAARILKVTVTSSVINSTKKLYLKECASRWDLDARVNQPDTCCNTKPLRPRHCVSFQSSHHFPGGEHDSCFQAQLINRRRYIVAVNTMANGNYGQIFEQFHGWAPIAFWQHSAYDGSDAGSLATHLRYCLHLARSFTPTSVDVPFMRLQRKPVKSGSRFVCLFLWLSVSLALARGVFAPICVRCTCASCRIWMGRDA